MATRPIVKKLKDDILFWNVMVYADPGAGKTVLAGSDLKVLYIATEIDGLMSAQTFGKGTNADRILIPDWETLINTYEWYDENQDELAQWDVIAIDSLTEMQYKAKDYVLRMGANEKLRKGRDPRKMEIQDYGEQHTLLEEMVRGFNDLPINVFYTATSKMVEGPDKETFLVPDLQGKKEYGIAMKVASLMTTYGYMRVEEHEIPAPTEENPKAFKSVRRRVIYWEDSGTIRGKDRTNKLRPFTMNNTLQQIRLAIKGDRVRNGEGFIVKKDSVEAKKTAQVAPPKVVKVVSQPGENKDEAEEKKDAEGTEPTPKGPKAVEAQASPEVEKQVDSTPEPTEQPTEMEESKTTELDAVDA